MYSKTEIGKILAYYLIDNDMTVKTFSDNFKVSVSTVYNWLAGKPMTNRYYIKLLKQLENYNPSKWVINKSEEELKDYMFDD